MERLTMIDGCGNDELARCMDCGLDKAGADLENCGMCEEGWQRALRKLAAYEDTGLEPEEIERIVDAYGRGRTLRTESAKRLQIVREIKTDRLRELADAEQDGLLVVLPCKVGDTVWVIWGKDVIYYIVDRIHILANNQVQIRAKHHVIDNVYLYPDMFDKTVFLTREEAEAALAEKGVTK